MKSYEPKETLVKPAFGPGREIWNKGEIIEGLYEVLAGPFDGGMGRVYKVKHLKWGIELAAKCPLPHFWEDEALMKRFEREVEAWIEIGRHPNIVNAYYVRNIDGIPYLFIERLLPIVYIHPSPAFLKFFANLQEAFPGGIIG